MVMGGSPNLTRAPSEPFRLPEGDEVSVFEAAAADENPVVARESGLPEDRVAPLEWLAGKAGR